METLADRIAREGPLNELDSVGWAVRLAKRIESMHVLGVIHGSISPQCMLIGGSDRTSRGYMVDVRRTSSSAGFHSPERVSGGGLSQADDVWAVAATLYFTLTGRAPFSGATEAETRQRVLSSAPSPLSVFDVGDDDLQHVIDHAFTRDLGRRMTSVSALRQALEEWHPDPNVGALPGLEDEDTDGDLDEELEPRTLMRAAPRTVADLPFSAPRRVPAAPPADEDDDDMRTMMRMPDAAGGFGDLHAPPRSGAFAAAVPPKSGSFPAQSRAEIGLGGLEEEGEEATRMLPSPAFPGERDDDEQATIMRPSAAPDEIEHVMSQMSGGAPAVPEPSGLAATVALDMLNLGPAPGAVQPARAAAFAAGPSAPRSQPDIFAPVSGPAPLPGPASPFAAPAVAVAVAVPAVAAAPRRTALWIVLVMIFVALAALAVAFLFLR